MSSIVDCANGLLLHLSGTSLVASADAAAVPASVDRFFARGELSLSAKAAGSTTASTTVPSSPDVGSVGPPPAAPPTLGPVDTAVSFDRCPDGRVATVLHFRPQEAVCRLGSMQSMVTLVDGAFFTHLPALTAMLQWLPTGARSLRGKTETRGRCGRARKSMNSIMAWPVSSMHANNSRAP